MGSPRVKTHDHKTNTKTQSLCCSRQTSNCWVNHPHKSPSIHYLHPNQRPSCCEIIVINTEPLCLPTYIMIATSHTKKNRDTEGEHHEQVLLKMKLTEATATIKPIIFVIITIHLSSKPKMASLCHCALHLSSLPCTQTSWFSDPFSVKQAHGECYCLWHSSVSPPTSCPLCNSHRSVWIGTKALWYTVTLVHNYKSNHLHESRWSVCGGWSRVFAGHETDSSSCKRVKLRRAHWLRTALACAHTQLHIPAHVHTLWDTPQALFRASISHST